MSPALVGAWAVGGYVYDVLWRSRKAEVAARAYCDRVRKPLLVVGCGTPGSSLRALLLGPQTSGEVNLDTNANSACARPAAVRLGRRSPPCRGDAHDLSRYPDRFFGAVLATHLLEHLPDPDRAVAEWRRVADRVYVVTPQAWWLHTYAHPGHEWVYLPGGRRLPLWRTARPHMLVRGRCLALR